MKSRDSKILILAFLLITFNSPSVDAKKQKDITKTKSICAHDSIKMSSCMIKAILDDIEVNYGATGGGGISKIVQLETLKYKIFLPQEERVDTITYTFNLKDNGETHILKRETGAVTQGKSSKK